jgi:hypothetical protein
MWCSVIASVLRNFRLPNLLVVVEVLPAHSVSKMVEIFCMEYVQLLQRDSHSCHSVQVGMQGCAPLSSSLPLASLVTLCVVSAIFPLLSFLLCLWMLDASGWAAVHEDLLSILYLVST